MANEKGFCNNCYTEGEEIRFFELNPKNKIVYCPRCGTQYTKEVAINNYNNLFNSLYEAGELALFKTGDYQEAWNIFSKIISLDEKDIYARYGRILALMHLSTLRNPKFTEVEVLFLEDRNKYLRSSAFHDVYLNFLRFFNLSIEEYIAFMKNNLTYRGYFYDNECASLYFERLFDIQNLKKLVLDESKFLVEKSKEVDYENFLDTVNNEYNRLEELIRSKVVDLKGLVYRFGTVGINGRPIIGSSEFKSIEKFKKPVIVKNLNAISRFKSINDFVYGRKKTTYTFSKFFVPSLIASVALSIIFFVLFIFIDSVKPLWVVLGIIFALVSVILIILRLRVIKDINVKDYSLIKPFRRK